MPSEMPKKTTNDPFEDTLLEETKGFIGKEFGIEESDLQRPIFHYTSRISAIQIVNTHIFHASFIRSTSDSLEFALPFSFCRDWLCFSKKFFCFNNFPTKFFLHFNEQAIDPQSRRYFLSACFNENSSHLKQMYGTSIVKMDISSLAPNFSDSAAILKCRYSKDIKTEVENILDRWKTTIFDPTVATFKIQIPEQQMTRWLYIFMHLCHSLSLVLKQDAFRNEDEVRISVVSRSIDEDTLWHCPRNIKRASARSLITREFLPLKLDGLGIKVS